ncbi:hypothetical protein GmHk_06G016624 [Glycine max]|nr:hypothetical protein GmHk_06G016624 [Glycine max]
MNDIARGADEKKDLEPGRWRTPPKDFIKLNCDGTAFQSQQVASCGGVVRDTLNAEFWAMFFDLQMVKEAGYHNFIVESDSSETVITLMILLFMS